MAGAGVASNLVGALPSIFAWIVGTAVIDINFAGVSAPPRGAGASEASNPVGAFSSILAWIPRSTSVKGRWGDGGTASGRRTYRRYCRTLPRAQRCVIVLASTERIQYVVGIVSRSGVNTGKVLRGASITPRDNANDQILCRTVAWYDEGPTWLYM